MGRLDIASSSSPPAGGASCPPSGRSGVGVFMAASHLQRVHRSNPRAGEASPGAARPSGATPRGARAVELLVAATALAVGLPLYTRNGEDFAAVEDLLDIIIV